MASAGALVVPFGPILCPTEEEFQDPIGYISSAMATYRQFGMVKIRPPPSWKPQFVCSDKEFTFRPRLQKVHELNGIFRVRRIFHRRLKQFLKLRGVDDEIPMLDGCTVDLYKLYQEVKRRGGMEKCTQLELWTEVCEAMGANVSRAKQLKNIYVSFLLSYEYHEIQTSAANNNIQPSVAKRRRRILEVDNLVCTVCKSGDEEASMLLCDKCDNGTHVRCLLPPLSEVPKGKWHCNSCIEAILKQQTPSSYGFKHSDTEYTFEGYRNMANDFEKTFFRGKSYNFDKKEEQFWHIVNNGGKRPTVMYGSDLSTLGLPYGFPFKHAADKDGIDESCAKSGWNLKNLPSLPGSALCCIDGQVSGVNVPWLYVGMCYSAFCWHTEDHWSYSVSYLHTGAVKTWYGISGDHAELFESVFKRLAPELFQFEPDLMHQLVTLIDPKILLSHDVPVYKQRQEPGEFIVTFPRCYHAGFNNGFNCAEAVNVCPADWIPYGRLCISNYALMKRLCVFAHDELMFKMATENGKMSTEMKNMVAQDVQCALWLERLGRNKLEGVGRTEMVKFEKINDDSRQCCVCSTTIFLSCLKCNCTKGNMVCLKHVQNLPCSCELNNCVLEYRYTLEEIEEILNDLL